MIRIKVNYEDNYIKKIILKGHADYASYGYDIVCAAVSATYICTVNGIISLFENDFIEVLSKDDTQSIIVLEKNDTINKLLENMIRCLKSLEEKYPNNIMIK